MSEYRKQTAFLRTLLSHDDNVEHRALSERLSAAEQNERCILSACRLVGLIAFLGLAGLGYSAVLLPQFFDNTTHVVIRFFCALSLGSLLCFGVFLSLWYGYRKTCNRIHEECRQAIKSMLAARLPAAPLNVRTLRLEKIELDGGAKGLSAGPRGADWFELPKAS
jgi:hypothetical protein